MSLDLKPKPGLFPVWNNNPMAIPAPIGAWVFNEGSGNKAFDLSGNDNTFTLYNHIWAGIGVQFNGIDAYGSANGLISKFGPSSETSMVVGYKPLTIPASNTFICGEVDIVNYNQDYGVYQTSIGTGAELWHYAESQIVDSNIAAIVNQIYDLCGIHKADGIQHYFYINGSYKGSAPTANIVSGGYNLILARWKARYLHCEIEYVYIYNCVLSAAQIAYLHQYPYYAWEYPELWEYYAAAAVGAEFELLIGAGGMDGGFLGGGLNPMTG